MITCKDHREPIPQVHGDVHGSPAAVVRPEVSFVSRTSAAQRKQSMRMLTVSFKWYQSRVDICMHVCYGFSDLRCWWMYWLWFAWWMEWLIEEFWNCCVLHKETEHRFDALSVIWFCTYKWYLMHGKRLLMLEMSTWVCLNTANCMIDVIGSFGLLHWKSFVYERCW